MARIYHLLTLVVALALTTNAGAQDINQGLVGYWPLDGSAVDASGNGHDGQVLGSLSYVADRNGVPGSAVAGFSLSSYVSIPHSQALMPNSAFSAGGFFRFDDPRNSGGQTLFSKSEGIDYAVRLWDGTMNSWGVSHSVTAFGTGSWHHVMITWDGNTMRLWINGSSVASASGMTPPGSFDKPLSLGIELSEWSGAPYDPFSGAVDEFRFYSRSLTTTEVQILAGLNVNQAPTADIAVDPATGPAPLEVQFSGAASSDPNGDALTYAWDLGGGTTSNGVSLTHRYASEGTYGVSLTVSDPAGLTDTATLDYTVTANLAPVADFSFFPQNSARPLMVYFDGSGSSDTAFDTITYSWDFGDGQTSTEQTVMHTFTDVSGAIPVTLTVTDSAGLTGSISRDVDVPNRPPEAWFTMTPETGMEPLEVTLASSSTDPDGDTVTYAWDFGDGATATGASVTHTFATLGTYDVTLTVTDSFGATTTRTRQVVVSRFNTAPAVVLSATPTTGQGPLEVTLDASQTTDAEGDAITFAWDLGDGTTASGATVTHTYNVAGTVSATVTATDALGMAATGTVSIQVETPANTIISSSSGGAWSSAGTWLGGSVPTATHLVLIKTTVTGFGANAGVTIESTGDWSMPNGGTISGPLTNRGSVTSTDGTLQIGGHLVNTGTLRASVTVTGNVNNSGNAVGVLSAGSGMVNTGPWSGPVSVAGDLENESVIDAGTGQISVGGSIQNRAGATLKGTLIVAGALESAGTVDATGKTVQVAGLVMNNGAWTSSLLELNGAEWQEIGHGPGNRFETRIQVVRASGKTQAEKGIRATTPLVLQAHLNLGNATLDMGSNGLTFVDGAYPYDGTIRHGGALVFSEVTGRNLTLIGNLTLAGDLKIAPNFHVQGDLLLEGSLIPLTSSSPLDFIVDGNLVNRGFLSSVGHTVRLRVRGSIHNYGDLSRVYAVVSGDIHDEGNWGEVAGGIWSYSANITLTGQGPRTIVFPRNAWMGVDTGARIRLVGHNLLPSLNGCDASGMACQVQPDAVVEIVPQVNSMATLDRNVRNFGQIGTRLRVRHEFQGYLDGAEYRLRVVMQNSSDLDSLVVFHQGEVPDAQAAAVRGWHRIESYPQGATTTTAKYLTFFYTPDELNGNEPNGLVLLHSEDQGVTWKAVSSPANTSYGAGEVRFEDVPISGDFVLTSNLESPGVFPTMTAGIIGAQGIRVGGPRLLQPIDVRYTNPSPVPLRDVILRVQLEGGIYVHSVQPSDPSGTYVLPDKYRIPVDSLTLGGNTSELLLNLRTVAPGESRRFRVWVWADRTGEKTDVVGVLTVTWLIGGSAYTVAVGKQWFQNLFGAKPVNCGDIEWMFWQSVDAVSRTGSRWLGGEIPQKKILEDIGKTIGDEMLAEYGISIPGMEPAEIGAEFLAALGEGMKQGLNGNYSHEIDCDWYRRKFLDPGEYYRELEKLFSWDPNDKQGPAGHGEAGYLSSAGRMDYMIRFENKAEAGAPAYAITIVDTLQAVFDPESVRFEGASHDLFTMTREGDVLTFEAVGIELPPNRVPPEGEGFVTFSAEVLPGVETGTTISNRAIITFDINDPIATNTVTNTMDFRAPVTTMTPLPAAVTGDLATVEWTADDEGSGVGSSALYVAKDGGPFALHATYRGNSAQVPVEPGHSYAFYVLSRDNVGNVEQLRPAQSTTFVSGVATEGDQPYTFELAQNYPNPFNPQTQIAFSLDRLAETRLEVFDLLGRRVQVLLEGTQPPGRQVVIWDAGEMASGIYFCRLQQADRIAIRSMVLLR